MLGEPLPPAEQTDARAACCTALNARVVIRARERREVWGSAQVLQCRTCGTRWSE